MIEKDLTVEEQACIEKIASHDLEQLRSWKQQLEEAKKQVEYWQQQYEHSNALAMRIKMSKW